MTSEDRRLPGPINQTLSIFLVSVLGLFLELLLIRWIGTEIRIFAYLQNTVLIVCFLGLGIGCFTCRQPIRIRHSLVALFALTVILAAPPTRHLAGQITDLLSAMSDLLIWEEAISNGALTTMFRVSLGLGLTLLLLVLLWEVFLPLGRLLGRLIDDHPHTIWAYSVNVAGSLIGIWLFVILSALSLPPVAWVSAAGLFIAFYLGTGRERSVNFALVAGLIVAAWWAGRDSEALQATWSPYQKLVLFEAEGKDELDKGQFIINVNNVGYQGMVDLSPKGVAANARITPEMAALSQYDVPLLFKRRPKDVLIVGAGSGNDVAGALRGGAERVTAVDIDPVIIEMGRNYHPEHPYDSPRVTVVNDDARSFFASSKQKYDLIIFGLLDSHTMTSMTNARLDHYVYTRESITRARSLLKDGGVLTLNFMAHRNYIADRIGGCVRDVFGAEALVFRMPSNASGWGGVMFVTGDQDVIQSSLDHNPQLSAAIATWQKQSPVELTYTTRLATDDWPYLYLERPSIPTLYYLLGALMLALLGYARRRCGSLSWGGKWGASHWHFFFLGAAFLLLEVQNISRASVALGNTWLVNAIIISGILTMVLLANIIAARFPKIPPMLVGVGLLGACLSMYWIDLAQFGALSYPVKAVLVGALTTLPMFFGGILFIQSFARVESKDRALGANLIGALAGGLLQTITFAIGVKALLLVVVGLYTAALLTRPSAALDDSQDEQDDDRDAVAEAPATSEQNAEPELATV